MRVTKSIIASLGVIAIVIYAVGHHWLQLDHTVVSSGHDIQREPIRQLSNNSVGSQSSRRILVQPYLPTKEQSDTRRPPPPPIQQSELVQASLAFKSLRQCHISMSRLTSLRNRLAACVSAAQYEGGHDAVCDKLAPELDTKIQAVEAQLSSCGTVPAQVELDYYQAVTQAAKLGNADAQICYVRGNFRRISPWTDEEIRQYQDQAQRYVDEAVARGDWRIVALLGTTNNYLAHTGGLMTHLAIGDAETVYKMNRLLRLGAIGDYANLLDTRINGFIVQLSPQQVALADEWAQDFFELHFANSEKLVAAPKTCTDSP